jgi:hypothetical protein
MPAVSYPYLQGRIPNLFGADYSKPLSFTPGEELLGARESLLAAGGACAARDAGNWVPR